MAFSSALVESVGFGVEATAGTQVTVTNWQPHAPGSASFNFVVNRTQGEGLHGSTNGFALASRHVATTYTVEGGVEFDLTDKGLGKVHRWLTGGQSTVSTLTTSVYQHVFQPGDGQGTGSSLTFQVGRPKTDGTVVPFTYRGCKPTSWSLESNITDPVTLTVDIDGIGQTTSTALTAVSLPTGAQQFVGADLTVLIGGTVTASSGVVSVTSPTTASYIKGVSISAANPLNTERFYAGSAGYKDTQVVNGMREMTIELDMDFGDTSSFYSDYTTNASKTLVLRWAKTTAYAGSYYPTYEIIVPLAKITAAPIQGEGTDLTSQKVTLVALYDDTNGFAPYQIRTVTPDSAV